MKWDRDIYSRYVQLKKAYDQYKELVDSDQYNEFLVYTGVTEISFCQELGNRIVEAGLNSWPVKLKDLSPEHLKILLNHKTLIRDRSRMWVKDVLISE